MALLFRPLVYSPGVTNGLLGSHLLETAIGLSMVYLMLASFCSAASEWIAALRHSRAATLAGSLRQLLAGQAHGEQEFIESFYNHPLIACLIRNGVHPPSLPSRAFSTAVFDLVTPGVEGDMLYADLKSGIEALPAGSVRTALLALIANTQGDLNRAQANIEGWFDDAMQRASAWYKRRTQLAIALLAAAVTIATNADSIAIAHRLSAGAAEIPLGWNSVPHRASEWIECIAGWILTTASVAMGAPFWFDVLNRFIHLREPRRTERRASNRFHDSTG